MRRAASLMGILLAGAAITSALMLRPDGAPAYVEHAASPLPPGTPMLFDDEFDGTGLDSGNWHTCFWWAPSTCTIETHDELGLYRSRNVSVADGVLTLRADREKAAGWNGETYDYTSGMVSSGGSPYSSPPEAPGFTFTYGYVESRLQVPAGAGLVSAFWLAMADHSWPPEVDIMEMLGSDTSRTTMHYHYRRANGTHATVGDGWRGPDFSAGWHTFGVDWEPGSLVWYVDGVKRAQFSGAAVADRPAYLVLNLAVGGTWGGPPDASTPLPAELRVDYVRVYQHRPTG